MYYLEGIIHETARPGKKTRKSRVQVCPAWRRSRYIQKGAGRGASADAQRNQRKAGQRNPEKMGDPINPSDLNLIGGKYNDSHLPGYFYSNS